ncbi:MAG: dienelactone hydrolase family protein [Saprospiraceae bacterium]|jgi:carboxymethylenebutenolidase|nr:dienelactone hydrolase family protein [Saprospiraceae bacterium]MBK6814391.1 dienelactone hydrolase family protein [Saprospiraceae bacterium]MBK8278862.1 dienelactone hydrolase family protein [Saprospiraceae bacterium]MBK8512483.1 dienelactone hydrolase family protein [Saprospiraceae bacterium]MBL0111558.1 dienelactone hydrolase family protein [Saprospiraceae bacterium]
MDQRIINLYDEYTHKPLSRTEFLTRLTSLVGSSAAAMLILPQLESDFKLANITDADELFTEYIHYPGAPGEMTAYVARPKELKKYPTVVVIHENRGLNAHIEDVARRAAKAGYLAIAPNALSALGRTFANEDEARGAFKDLKPEDSLQNFIHAFDYAKTRNDSNGKFGCVGFCWGGAMTNNLAVNVPDLKAAVAFYGRQPAADKVPNIHAALQLHYGALDEGVNAGIPAYEAALKANNKVFEIHMYEGAQHAFHNDTSEARYNEAAAKLAWARTLEFWAKYLS